MLKIMRWLVFSLFLLCFMGLTDAGQETVQVLYLYGGTSGAMSQSGHLLAVSVRNEDIDGVSSSVLKAETWLRTYVLSHFPSTRITTILVANPIFCQNGQNNDLGMVLQSVKNIYYSLTRWGLEKEIKVSAVFASPCIDANSVLFSDDMAEKFTKPLLEFLYNTNSTYSLILPPNFSPVSDEMVRLVYSQAELLKKFGYFVANKVNVIVANPEQQMSMNRKLINIQSETVKPYPPGPKPLPETSRPPLHSSIGFSAPANIAKNPHPPLPQIAPPPMIFPFAPEQPPLGGPSTSPYGYLPPCNPADTPAPAGGVVQELWCVAKPSVPEETLQEALDYACGDGGADCSQILPHGNCFYPNTTFAHASYAFNSYYQNNKRNGGSCTFGGTAMLITSDPSSLHCRFLLS